MEGAQAPNTEKKMSIIKLVNETEATFNIQGVGDYTHIFKEGDEWKASIYNEECGDMAYAWNYGKSPEDAANKLLANIDLALGMPEEKY